MEEGAQGTWSCWQPGARADERGKEKGKARRGPDLHPPPSSWASPAFWRQHANYGQRAGRDSRMYWPGARLFLQASMVATYFLQTKKSILDWHVAHSELGSKKMSNWDKRLRNSVRQDWAGSVWRVRICVLYLPLKGPGRLSLIHSPPPTAPELPQFF